MVTWLLLISLCGSGHCLWTRLASSFHLLAAPDQPVCTLLSWLLRHTGMCKVPAQHLDFAALPFSLFSLGHGPQPLAQPSCEVVVALGQTEIHCPPAGRLSVLWLLLQHRKATLAWSSSIAVCTPRAAANLQLGSGEATKVPEGQGVPQVLQLS